MEQALKRLPALCEVGGCSRKPHTRRDGVAVCNMHWQRLHRHGTTENPPPRPWSRCLVRGCPKQARTRHGTTCEMHYYRRRRTGLIFKPRRRTRTQHGYIRVAAPGHPLRQGRHHASEYEHRIVFYDAHGVGPFACHVCSATIDWDTMHVDHLDGDRSNNAIENLAPACPACNQARGAKRRGHVVSFAGFTGNAREWAERIGISRTSLVARLRSGWPLERALTEPRGVTGPR